MAKNVSFVDVGTFEVSSGKVHVTDPCYNVGTWCGNYDVPAKNGTYKATTLVSDEGEWGKRVAGILVVHSEHVNDVMPDDEKGFWLRGSHIVPQELPNEVGVDSGQAGVFDASIYPTDKAQLDYGRDDDPEKYTWYRKVYNTSISEEGCGIVEGGAVSLSGFGDGGYTGTVFSHDKKNIGFYIDFQILVPLITEDYDDWDYDDEDEDKEVA